MAGLLYEEVLLFLHDSYLFPLLQPVYFQPLTYRLVIKGKTGLSNQDGKHEDTDSNKNLCALRKSRMAACPRHLLVDERIMSV